MGNPIRLVDPDGRSADDIIVTSKDHKDGSRTITFTVTGVLINDSSKEYTNEEMRDYSTRLTNAIKHSFSGEDGDIKFNAIVSIRGGEESDLKSRDHAFRIVDEGAIPGDRSKEGESSVLGMAAPGENFVYLTQSMLDNAVKYPGTAKDKNGKGTLERTGPHELGHSGGLPHPPENTVDGNLMHQTRRTNAGRELNRDQVLLIEKYFDQGLLNKGKQSAN